MNGSQENNILGIGTILSNGDRKYRIVEVLGIGGFGITYLAVGEVMVGNVTTEAKFAIKEHFPAIYCNRDGILVIPKADKADEFTKSKSDFVAEAHKLHALGVENKNIVKVNEVFEENGTAYYVMQYINGKSLTSYVKSHGKLSYNTAISLLTPIINAVEFLHKSRINHLDIKPDNIMLHDSIDGLTPILIDFGLSIHFKKNGDKTSPKSIMGVSDGYSPLEQYAGIREFIPQADIYALAATLIYMLSGETPKSASDLRVAEVRDIFIGRLPENIVSAICKAMSKSYEDRTATVGIFKSDLGISTGDSGKNTVVIDIEEDDKKRKLRLFIVSIIVIAFVGIVIALFPKGVDDNASEEQVAKTDSLTKVESVGNDSMSIVNISVPGVAVSEQGMESGAEDHGTQTANSRESNPIEASDSKPQSVRTPKPTKISEETNGTLSLGYATWVGGIKNGRPEGNGRMTYHSSYRVSGTVQAAPGDYIIGNYERGKLVSGKFYDSNGNFIKSVIP